MKSIRDILSYWNIFPCIVLGLFLTSQSVFGASGDILELNSAGEEKPQTLREMQENISSLEQQKVQLDFKWTTFRVGNENLGDLIKKDLRDEQKQVLEDIILLYSKDKENFEEDISAAVESGEEIEEIKKDLLLLKQEFYKSLIPYIQLEKLRDFTRYVDSDLSYREKSNEVATQIEQKSILRDERLEEIEEQIQTNKDHLHAQIKEKVTLRVQNRLDVFIYQENFQSLPDISKIRIFERLITKIQEKRKKLENTPNSTSIVEETMILYEIVEEIFEGYLSKWQ